MHRAFVFAEPRFEGDVSLRVALLDTEEAPDLVKAVVKAIRAICGEFLEKLEEGLEVVAHLKDKANLSTLAAKLDLVISRIVENYQRRHAVTTA